MINSVKSSQSIGSKQRVKIFAVDPATRTIHATLMREGAGITVAVWETGTIFRWPKEGEIWTVYKGTNGIWMLDKPVETVETTFPVESMSPGQAKINAEKIFNETGQGIVSVDESSLVNNDILRWDGDQWVRQSMVWPQARVFNSGNISVTNNTTQVLTFNLSHYDNAFQHSNVTNNSRLTAPLDGLYQMGCNVEFAASATGVRQVELLLQGGTIIASDRRNAVSTGTTRIQLATQTRLFATWYVEVRVLQDSGGALNVNFSNQYSPEFWWFRVSP